MAFSDLIQSDRSMTVAKRFATRSGYSRSPSCFCLPPSPTDNQLLARLDEAEHNSLFNSLELVVLKHGSVLREAGQHSRHIYFPVDAVISEMYLMTDGASTQVAIIGHEGLIGLSALIGGKAALSTESVISDGYAYRLPRAFVQQEFNRSVQIQKSVLCYTQALLTQMAQTAVCNRHHVLDQQLCRWLLLVLDRTHSYELSATHGMIATMLGVRREGVTAAAAKLQAAGIISARRGKLTINNRPGLEQRCCECYGVICSEFARLLPASRQAR